MKVFCTAFLYLQFGFVIFLGRISVQKLIYKMLVKLSIGKCSEAEEKNDKNVYIVQRSQTRGPSRGPHVARERVQCGPRTSKKFGV